MEPLGLAWGLPVGGCSPDEVGEALVQVHRGGGAAEHGQNALQVQQLQLLAVAVEEQNQHRDRDKKQKAKLKRRSAQTLPDYQAIPR